MRLLVDYAVSPLAIGTRCPRFSWEVPLQGRGRHQSAYRILVAGQTDRLQPGEADVWDSGKVLSSRSVGIEYGGARLCSNRALCWAVQIWDETGQPTAFSEPQWFGTGLFDAADWQGEWIGLGADDEPLSDPEAFQQERVPPEIQAIEPDPAAPMMRTEFRVDKPVRRARAFVCGLGLFELRLNGIKVGEDVLSTPRTDFRKRVLYCCYDISEQLERGANALGLMLGNGWFNGQKKYWGWQMQWYGTPRALVQLEIEHDDGTRTRVVSDRNWRGYPSPITFNCIYDGEAYDARLEQEGWDRPGFNDTDWRPVNPVPAPGGRLEALPHEPERVVERIRPVAVREPEPGVFVYNMGRNITGWVRLTVKDGRSGETIRLRFGEAEHENGALNASSNNAARQQDDYTQKGSEHEVYEPRFTFHGFQFVELTGYPGVPDLDTVEGCFARTAVEQTGRFACGNELINRIHRCTLQSQLCNVQMGVPTDDTQRPERLGWGADAWGTAVEALYNLWMPRVYAKWTGDFRDQQNPQGLVGMITPQAGAEEDLVWSAAFLLIPWWQYLHCGDRRILQENYPALKRYLAYLQRVGVREIRPESSAAWLEKLFWRCGENRFPPENERGHLQIAQWGDHLATAEGAASRSNLPLSIATAFYYLDLVTMVRIAGALGEEDDARYYAKRAGEVRAAFNERFFHEGLGRYDTGVQSAQAWALAFGLVPEEQRERVGTNFVRSVAELQRHLTTGYAGTKFAVQTLSMLGRDDLVWRLATATEYPSWGYMLRHNRTTSCERWDGEKGSLNHAPLGAAVDEWFYWGLAGIRPDESAPGYERILFKPYFPPDLPWAEAALQTPRGRVASRWQRDGNGVRLELCVPANCTAIVGIPAGDGTPVREGEGLAAEATGVRELESGDTRHFELQSGNYQFAFDL